MLAFTIMFILKARVHMAYHSRLQSPKSTFRRGLSIFQRFWLVHHKMREFIVAIEVNPVSIHTCTKMYSTIHPFLVCCGYLKGMVRIAKTNSLIGLKRKISINEPSKIFFLTFWLFKIWNYNSFCILLFLWGQKYFVSSNSIDSNVTQN